jgi:hypothetical protein
VVQTAATAVGRGAGKVINAVKNNLDPKYAGLVEEFRRRKIPFTYGDIARTPGAQRHEVLMEQVPFSGMPGLRQTQHDAARGEAEGVLSRLESAYKSIAPADIADLEAAAKAGDDHARRVLDQIRNAGDDPDRIIQASIGLQNFRTGKQAEQLYNRVEHLVLTNGLGDVDVPAGGIRDVVGWALNDAEGAVVKNKPAVNLLREIQGSIGATNTFARLRRFHSDISRIIREHRENEHSIIGKEGVGYLERIRGAIEGDLQDFVDNSGVPEIQEAARAADEFYKRMRVPFKDAQLTAAASNTEPDQVLQRFLMEGKGDRAQKLYNALDPRAQAAVRYEMVQRAVDQAFDTKKGIFSPTEFAGYLEKQRKAYGIFFQGRDKWEMDGLRNVMEHIARAGQFMENPPTGNRWIGHMMNYGLPTAGATISKFSPEAGALVVGVPAAITGLSRFLLTTEPGKRFLLAGSAYKPGSKQMERLLETIGAQMAQAGGKAAGAQTGR